MWKSPIEILMETQYETMLEKQEEVVIKAVNKCLVNHVDVPRLEAALRYDYQEYQKAYLDGYIAAKDAIIAALSEWLDIERCYNDVLKTIIDATDPTIRRLTFDKIYYCNF